MTIYSPFATKSKTGRRSIQNFNLFKRRRDGLSPSQFQRLHTNDMQFSEDLLLLIVLLYDLYFVELNIAGRIVQKNQIIVKLLTYNDHTQFLRNIFAGFHTSLARIVTFLSTRAHNQERHLTTCSERVKNVYPRNVNQIRETFPGKVESFGMKSTNPQQLSKYFAKMYWESTSV